MNTSRQIQAHLDGAADRMGYLDAINGTTPESLIDAQMKMHPLLAALGNTSVGSIASIGVGQGEELHALRLVFGPEPQIIGVDLSTAALQRSRERSDAFKLNTRLIEADARELPFARRSTAAIVMSAIIHEIYSYNEPNGRLAYEQSIRKTAAALEPGGILYVREFACPPQEEAVKLIPTTEEASDFFDYFTSEFHIGLQGDEAAGVQFDRNGRLKKTGDLTQILLHFRNFWHDHAKGLTSVGDAQWKELNESYVVPNATGTDFMDPMELCDDIVETAYASGEELELVELSVKMRKKVNLFLAQHFRIENRRGKDDTRRLLHISTGKLEATFRKIAD